MTQDEQTTREFAKASGSMGRFLGWFDRQSLPTLDVLDYGCGWGGETAWLSRRVRSVVGVDVDPETIEQAERVRRANSAENCRFLLSENGRIPVRDESFDAVFSTDTFEHVMDLKVAFLEIFRVLKPGGVLVASFAPLFYSPYGYHLRWACQVPYAHLLFGLQPVLQLRNERAGSTLRANRWEDTGLNRMRFRDFRQAAKEAGFELDRFQPIPVRGLRLLTYPPLVGDLFVFGVDCRIRRPQA